MATNKTQTVRLLDVFVFGPFMVWYAVRSEGMSPLARWLLGATGVGTIAYNGRNYLNLAERSGDV
jgi:hypothetical protein